MNPLDKLHSSYLPKRFDRLATLIAPLLPERGRILDVGTGSGQIPYRLMKLRSDLNIEGIDVLLRTSSAIPVTQFNGKRIPFPDKVFAGTMLIDVLHHTSNQLELINEAVRVSYGPIIIKDHLLKGLFAQTTLRLMDSIGNNRFGVATPYNYWRQSDWIEAFDSLGLECLTWSTNLKLYPSGIDLICGRSLHFLAKLIPVQKSP